MTTQALAKLRRELRHCSEQIEHLDREIATNIRDMAAMQKEIHHLRSLMRST